jgi:hypothetical protein
VDQHPEPEEPGGDSGRLHANAQNEAIGDVVDSQSQHERPERVLANTFPGRVVRVRAGEHLGQKQNHEAPDEARNSPFSSKLETLGKEIHERQGKQYSGCKGSRVRPASCTHVPTEQG